jgi:very-short-patch-repair endonuclease
MIVDMSGSLSARELGPVLDDQLRAGMNLRALQRCIGRLPPAPGRRPSVIHSLLGARLPGYDPGDSDLETKVLSWLTGAGLSPPRQQFRVRINGKTYKLDLAYADEFVGMETDGWDRHRSRTAFDYDRERANDLAVAGWLLLRFTSHSTREDVVNQVTAARGRFGQRPAA